MSQGSYIRKSERAFSIIIKRSQPVSQKHQNYRHSGYTGNLKSTLLSDLLKEHPERVLQLAVKGMLPVTKRGRQMLRRLKIYAEGDHPHQAQLTSKEKEGR